MMPGESRTARIGSDEASMAATDIEVSAADTRGWRTFALVAAALFAVAACLAALASGAAWPLAVCVPAAIATGAAVAWSVRPRVTAPPEVGFERLTLALSEPAAVVTADGRIETPNDAWLTLIGAARRLEASSLGGLHGLLRQSAREGGARQEAPVGGDLRQVEAARLDPTRYLVRIAPTEPGPNSPTPQVQAAVSASLAPPKLDAFAAASPFGAALIEGEDPFAGPILETNATWPAIAGEAARPGTTLGNLLDEATRQDAAARFAKGGAGPFEVTPKAKPGSAAHL
jgi:two-component system cell cycle sensor histidine kinase/response regulator CckA